MKQECKIQCYQDSYQELKNISQVKNLQYPEEKKNLDFSCDISDIHVEYSMRLGTDFLTVRGERPYPGCSDSELTEIGQKIVEGTTIKFTAYNETLFFQLSLPLFGIADEDARNLAVNESSKFFHFLLDVAGVKEISESQNRFKEIENNTPCKSEGKGKLSKEKILPEKSISEEKREKSNFTSVEKQQNTKNNSKKDYSDFGETKSFINCSKKDEESLYEKESKPQTLESNKKIHANEMSSMQSHENAETRRNELEYLIAMRAENNRRESELKELQKELQIRDQELLNKEDVLHNTLSQLKSEKQALVEKSNTLEQIKSDAQGKVEQAYKSLKEEENKTSNMKSKIDELQSKYDKSQNELSKLKQNNSKLRESIAEKESKISSLNSTVNQFEQILQEESDWNKEIQSERDELIQKVAGKDFEIESLKRESSLKKTDLEKEREIALQKQAESYKEQIKSLCDMHEKELQEMLSQHEKKVKALEEELNENSLSIKEQIDLDNRDIIMKLESEISEKCEIIVDLENRLKQYRNNSSLGTPEEVLEDFAETRKENRRLQREIEDIKEECNVNSKSLLKQIEDLNLIIKEKEQENKEISKRNTLEYKSAKIISETGSMGIILNATDTGEIVGKRDGCEIIIYPEKDMLICKTTVTRASKYVNNINKWNDEDITEMYYSTKKEIICKKKYDNISIDLQKIIRRFVLLK